MTATGTGTFFTDGKWWIRSTANAAGFLHERIGRIVDFPTKEAAVARAAELDERAEHPEHERPHLTLITEQIPEQTTEEAP
jgi:hypothetical protein